MFNLQTPFGLNMIKNFQDRGIPLSSAKDYQDQKTIETIYSQVNLKTEIISVKDFFYNIITN
jgi:hypothetical protein